MKKRTKRNIASFALILATLITSGIGTKKFLKDYNIDLPDISNVFNLNNNDNKENGTNEIIDSDKSSSELLQEVKTTYNFDLNGLVIPNANNECTKPKINKTATEEFDKTKKLMMHIEENSNKYLSAHPKYKSIFFKSNTDKDINHDQINISSILEDIIKQTITYGSNKDICIIGNLIVILNYNSNPNENINIENNVITININAFKNTGKLNCDKLKNELNIALRTIRLLPCNCQDNTTYPYEFLQKDVINSDISRCESLIIALGMFNKDNTIHTYDNAIYSNNIKELYDYCGISSNEDIAMLNRILYAMNILYKLEDKDLTIEEIGYDYVVELYHLFINNMINHTKNNKDFTLIENLLIFSILTDNITLEVDTNVKDDSIDNLNLLYNAYFKFLCEHYKTTFEEIERLQNEIKDSYLFMIDICNKDITYEDINKNNHPKASEIIKKYPLLKEILKHYTPTSNSYSKFLKN